MFDIHCHILHDVDDGSDSLQESQKMLFAAHQAGITGMVCTPHCRGKSFDYDRIVRHYAQLQPYAEKMGMQFDLGFEVYCEKLVEIGIDWAPRLMLGDSGMLLLELNYGTFPPNLSTIIMRLQDMGLQIIIAHPERYVPVQKNIEKALQLRDMGCLLQLSGDFVTDNRRGPRTKAATALLREDAVDYIGSDAHCVADYANFKKAVAFARKF